MSRGLALAPVLWLLAGAASPAGPAAPPAELAPPPPGLDARQLAGIVEQSLRSDGTYLEAGVRIAARRTDRLELSFRSWDDRRGRRSFVQVLEPGNAGTSLLRLGPNVWEFSERGNGPRRIPPAELAERWMGTHFSYDDVLHVSDVWSEYQHRVLGVERGPEWAPDSSFYVLESRPRAGVDAPWSRIAVFVEVQRVTPLRIDYFDGAGTLKRTLWLEDLRPVQGRLFPYRWRMVRADKPARDSVVEVREVRFDQHLDDAIFTTRHLLKDQ